jgi:hypothetical protein
MKEDVIVMNGVFSVRRKHLHPLGQIFLPSLVIVLYTIIYKFQEIF